MKDKRKSKTKSGEWNPYKSKWKAALEKDLDIKLTGNENILYLGASSGTTVGQLSKLTKGTIFAVENSPKMAIGLVKLATERKNIAPIFADARNTEFIKKSLFNSRINILFQDIPSTDQIHILEKVSELVDKNCKILLSLKTQSISQADPRETSQKAKEDLRKSFAIRSITNLAPFHKKHYFFVLNKK